VRVTLLLAPVQDGGGFASGDPRSAHFGKLETRAFQDRVEKNWDPRASEYAALLHVGRPAAHGLAVQRDLLGDVARNFLDEEIDVAHDVLSNQRPIGVPVRLFREERPENRARKK
jgi:hypothetical protein